LTTSPEERPEDEAGVDGDELERRVRAGEVPDGALRQRLAALVGAHARILHVRPVGLPEHAVPVVPIEHGGDGRRDDHPRDPGGGGGAQHPQGALARGDDQLVVGARRRAGHRARHVQHEATAGDRLGPAGVGRQVRRDHGEVRREPGPRGLGEVGRQQRGELRAAPGRAGRAADPPAALQELNDGVLRQESRGAGDEDEVRHERCSIT
jgi:hypothetical protein